MEMEMEMEMVLERKQTKTARKMFVPHQEQEVSVFRNPKTIEREECRTQVRIRKAALLTSFIEVVIELLKKADLVEEEKGQDKIGLIVDQLIKLKQPSESDCKSQSSSQKQTESKNLWIQLEAELRKKEINELEEIINFLGNYKKEGETKEDEAIRRNRASRAYLLLDSMTMMQSGVHDDKDDGGPTPAVGFQLHPFRMPRPNIVRETKPETMMSMVPALAALPERKRTTAVAPALAERNRTTVVPVCQSSAGNADAILEQPRSKIYPILESAVTEEPLPPPTRRAELEEPFQEVDCIKEAVQSLCKGVCTCCYACFIFFAEGC